MAYDGMLTGDCINITFFWIFQFIVIILLSHSLFPFKMMDQCSHIFCMILVSLFPFFYCQWDLGERHHQLTCDVNG